MHLEVLYEDSNIAVILKPAGISTHPGAGSSQNVTLIDLLQKRFSSLSRIGAADRPGIVHRLDKDTSGLLLIAKTDTAYSFLTDQFKKRKIKKFYKALVFGRLMPKKGSIEAGIGRNFLHRKKMTSLTYRGKPAVTHYKVLQYYTHQQIGECTLLEIQLETGRTHQIRVHFQAIGFPVAGDSLYGRKVLNQQFALHRQFLHAFKIHFPTFSREWKTIESRLPLDLEEVLKGLRPCP